jgi:hypothetical protein
MEPATESSVTTRPGGVPIKRYISGYVTGGLPRIDVTRDNARVTGRNPSIEWEVIAFQFLMASKALILRQNKAWDRVKK